MSEPFIAEIKIFAGNFAPRGYAFCNGQLLPIAQNTALFSLIGVTYGGDGRTTMGLPNLQGRAAMHPGNGPGLGAYRLGERGGASTATLTATELPSHSHQLRGSSAETEEEGTADPTNASLGTVAATAALYGTPASPGVAMSGASLPSAGQGGAHNNVQPYQVLNFVIALTGIYPPRP